jgi:hypothetical protein
MVDLPEQHAVDPEARVVWRRTGPASRTDDRESIFDLGVEPGDSPP